MADNIKETRQRLELSLEYLLTNPSTCAYLKQNKEFQTVIKNEIYILKSFIGDRKVKKVIEKYNSISPTKYDDKPTVSLKDDTDKIDYVNYLITYVRNIFKIDLKSIDKKDISKAKKIENKEVKSIGDETNQAFNAGAAFGAAGGMPGYGNFDPSSPTITIPNPAIQQQAQANVNDKLLRGEVYMFTSKPKVIPIFKIIYTVVMLLFAASLIGACVCMFMLNGHYAQSPYDSKVNGSVGTIANGIFCILFALLFVYMGFADMIRTARIHSKTKTKPSDNEKYQVTGISVGFTILFAVFIVFMVLWPVWGLPTIYTLSEWFPAQTDKNICLALVILTSICFAMLALTIASAIVLLACKPKVNTTLLNSLMEEEMRKLMGNASFGGFTPPVQEAVVEEKPKKKDKKDDKELKN